jgi:hypothetical protein
MGRLPGGPPGTGFFSLFGNWVENRQMHPPESPNLDGANQTFLVFWTRSQERKDDEKERGQRGFA